METSPYSTPAANPYGSAGDASTNMVSTAAIQQLTATKPWVRFISVITFIGAGLMVVFAILMFIMGSVGTMSKSGAASPFTGAMGFGMAVLYAVLSIIYIFPGVKLWKYASLIAILMQTGRDEDLVAALNQQRSFWKFVGILIIAVFVLYVFVIIGAIAFGGFVAMKASGTP